MSSDTSTALITGASSGLGRVYADRLGRRGFNQVLVARDKARLVTVATELAAAYGIQVDVMQADLTVESDLARVEKRLQADRSIDLLVNNAGAAAPGSFANATITSVDNLIRLNVVAVGRLAAAIVPPFLERGAGSIINIASVVALTPEIPMGIYGPTKAFVLSLSQAMHAELGPKGIYVQAVLPPATRTEIWQRSGRDINALKAVMEVDDLVDASLIGFDRKESVSLPSLPDEAQWEAYVSARRAMLPLLMQSQSAARYRAI